MYAVCGPPNHWLDRQTKGPLLIAFFLGVFGWGPLVLGLWARRRKGLRKKQRDGHAGQIQESLRGATFRGSVKKLLVFWPTKGLFEIDPEAIVKARQLPGMQGPVDEVARAAVETNIQKHPRSTV
jgi:hypothetical protein